MASDTPAATTPVNDGSQKGNTSPASNITLRDYPDSDKDCRQVLNDGPGKDDTSPVTNSNVEDHPDGAEIRRQVEYYFSDENLPTDLHLLQCCGGRENLPVSINRICGFRRMRHYKPKSLVVAALRLSTFLEVSEDGKAVKRKVPLQGKSLLDPDFLDDEDIAYDTRVQKPAQYPVPLIPQSKAERNTQKPTGFETTYVEPLLTAEEAAKEEDMYDPEKHFVERIELAIQRFKQKRRMLPKYALAFEKLVRFGGVEAGPRMYQGLSKQDMKDMDAEELARALATYHVPWDRSDESQWVVDFEAVCKGFLSSWYPTHYGCAPSTVKNACQVVRSFFRYLMYHKVCPEYDDQLAAALQICDTAEGQLFRIDTLCHFLAGDFNKSASVIFGGAQAGLYVSHQAWVEELKGEGLEFEDSGFSEEEARVRFGIAMAILGSEEQFKLYQSSQLEVLDQKSTLLEVVAIHLPDDDTKATFAAQSKLYQHKLDIEPLGKLICRTWYVDGCEEYDLPRDKYPTGKPCTTDDCKEYEFWIDERMLRQCFIGMKVDADILMLSGDLAVLDSVKEIMCSFYVWLPNELWMDRKPKEVRWLKNAMGLDEEEDQDDKTKENADNDPSDDEFDDE